MFEDPHMLSLNIIWHNSEKEKKKISRSQMGGVGCHCDKTHFNIADPYNWYPSWQIYWIVSLVVRSGWIISLWAINGGDSQVFSYKNQNF